jgi:hypothetical protein
MTVSLIKLSKKNAWDVGSFANAWDIDLLIRKNGI